MRWRGIAWSMSRVDRPRSSDVSGPTSEVEAFMLEGPLVSVADGSRLTCQTTMTEGLASVTVHVPEQI